MRYLILIMAMLGDLMLLAACIGVIYYLPQFTIVGVAVMIYLLDQTYDIWKEQGGLMAWNPYWIKRFMKNAKEIGL